MAFAKADPEHNSISQIGIGPITQLFSGNKQLQISNAGNDAMAGNAVAGGQCQTVKLDRSNKQSDGDPEHH